MAQFIGLVTLNAENFDSGNAGDGEVLTADGLGGTAWEAAGGGIDSEYATPGAIKLFGSLTEEANQIYIPNGTANGKVAYQGITDSLGIIQWSGSYWEILYDPSLIYLSYDDVATPDLVTDWYAESTVEVAQNPGSLFMVAPGWANEFFYPNNTSFGKTFYTGVYYSGSVYWVDAEDPTPDYWTIQYNGEDLYTSTEDVATPDLVTTWVNGTGGSPAPVFSATEILSVDVVDFPDGDGLYVSNGLVNGKESFTNQVGSNYTFQWSGTFWEFSINTVVEIISLDDVATPDLVSNWYKEKLLTVLDFTNYPAGSPLEADGSGGTQWANPGGKLVTWATNAGIGKIQELFNEMLTAAGLVETLHSLKNASYFISYSDGSGGDFLGVLWYIGGEINSFYFRTVGASATWPTGTCKLLGCYVENGEAYWEEVANG